jgi:hypothetical protein
MNEKPAKMTEIRLFPVKLQVTSHLSIITVIKECLTRFLATDPTVYIVSHINANIIIRTTDELNSYSAVQIWELFPRKIINKQTNLRFFMAASMTISRLKNSSSGYYEYTSKHIWLSDDVFKSHDIRNIGFIIRKDINRVDRELVKSELFSKLTNFVCSSEDKQQLTNAREYLPFPACIPNFQIRLSKNISVGSSSGKVSTSALTIHCDALHVNFLNKFITQFYDESDTDEKYVPHSMLNGKYPDFIKAYRNATVFQN